MKDVNCNPFVGNNLQTICDAQLKAVPRILMNEFYNKKLKAMTVSGAAKAKQDKIVNNMKGVN